MKRIVSIAVIITVFSFAANAQEKSLGVGGNIGANALFGDSRVLDSQGGINTGVYGLYQFSPRVNLIRAISSASS